MPCTSSLGLGLGLGAAPAAQQGELAVAELGQVLDGEPGALRHVVADTNPARIAVLRRRVGGQGYAAGDVPRMLDREKVDVLLVSSVDATHDTYIVAGLEAGCNVITEKPMTVEPARCRRILGAQCQTGRRVTAAFNYRYDPVRRQVRELRPRIGEIGSVHCEWLLDVRHGADCFRRWHRDKANSGGLLVHKATHHFDLVNWWLRSAPDVVCAQGRLFFYGEAGARHGYVRVYERLAANQSLATQRSVRAHDLLDLTEWES